VEELNQMRAIQ